MKSVGYDSIYLTGSKKTIRRSVKFNEENNKYYIVFYGNLIEVETTYSGYGFRTVESY